jgi:hypothetical protein
MPKGIRKKWSKENILLLKKEYPSSNLNELSKLLNRSIMSIMGKASKLDISRLNKHDNLNNNIKELYLNGNSSTEIAKKLEIKSHSIINRHLEKMGVKRRNIKESVNLTFKNGRKTWSKGLSKEHNESIRKMCINFHGKKGMIRTKEHNLKIGLANKGKKHSEESKEKLRMLRLGKKNPKHSLFMKNNNPMYKLEAKEKASERMKGDKNYFWIDGSLSKIYKDFTIFFKNKIRKRDNQICMLCGVHREKLKKALCIHHIDYNKKLSIPQNCISLCDSCHSKTHFNREHWTKLFQSLLSEKYRYEYSNDNIVIKFDKE